MINVSGMKISLEKLFLSPSACPFSPFSVSGQTHKEELQQQEGYKFISQYNNSTFLVLLCRFVRFERSLLL